MSFLEELFERSQPRQQNRTAPSVSDALSTVDQLMAGQDYTRIPKVEQLANIRTRDVLNQPRFLPDQEDPYNPQQEQ